MRQLKESVKQGCQMAEEILTPASACHHALPLIIMEHSTMLPDQAALWHAIVQVQFGTPRILGIPTSGCMVSFRIAHESNVIPSVSSQPAGNVWQVMGWWSCLCRSYSCLRRRGSALQTGGHPCTGTCRACRARGMPFSHR